MSDTTEAVALSPVAIDILTEHLGLDSFWFPIEVPYHGDTETERTALATEVWNDLARRGLARGNRIDSDLEAALRLLARPDNQVSLLAVLDDGRIMRARAVDDGYVALVAHQDADDGPVRITELPPSQVYAHTVDLIGTGRAHPAASVSIPLPADAEPGDDFGFSETPVDFPATRWTAETVWQEKRIRAGVFTVTVGGHRRSVSSELEWFDTEGGRRVVRQVTDRSGRRTLVCEPAGNREICRQLDRLLNELRDDD
jgi:hypothetical protein